MRGEVDRTAVRVVRLDEAGGDFTYWQAQTPEARLRALETIRREYHAWRYGAEPRLQRVYRIVERA
ncbi:MAG TPA: hypothetical protein VK002_14295 [Rubricoccaceae bacterium]|nr:hypothetical protein [Rubricoccaceae bacterium]